MKESWMSQNLKRKQSGFSLVELVTAGAVLTVVMFSVSKVTQYAVQTGTTTNISYEAEAIRAQIEMGISNPNNCFNSFQTVSFDGTSLVNITQVVDANGNVLLAEKQHIGNITIESIQALNNSTAAGELVTVGDPSGIITLRLNMRQKGGWGSAARVKDVPINYVSNVIGSGVGAKLGKTQFCASSSGPAFVDYRFICENLLGGTYDPATGTCSNLTSGSTIPSITCPTDQAVVGFDATTGNPLCSGTAGHSDYTPKLVSMVCPASTPVVIGTDARGQAVCGLSPLPATLQNFDCGPGKRVAGFNSVGPYCSQVLQTPTYPYACQPGKTVTGFDSLGNPVCSALPPPSSLPIQTVSCPAGKVVVGFNMDGSLKCDYPEKASCMTPGQVVMGFDINGALICSDPLPKTSICSSMGRTYDPTTGKCRYCPAGSHVATHDANGDHACEPDVPACPSGARNFGPKCFMISDYSSGPGWVGTPDTIVNICEAYPNFVDSVADIKYLDSLNAPRTIKSGYGVRVQGLHTGSWWVPNLVVPWKHVNATSNYNATTNIVTVNFTSGTSGEAWYLGNSGKKSDKFVFYYNGACTVTLNSHYSGKESNAKYVSHELIGGSVFDKMTLKQPFEP